MDDRNDPNAEPQYDPNAEPLDPVEITVEDFAEAARRCGRRVPPQNLMDDMVHHVGSAGSAFTLSETANLAQLTVAVGEKILNGGNAGTARVETANALGDLAPHRLGSRSLTKSVPSELADLPDTFTRGDLIRRQELLRALMAGDGQEAAKVRTEAGEGARAAAESLLARLAAVVTAAPHEAEAVATKVKETIDKLADNQPDPDPVIREFEGMVARYRAIDEQSDVLTADLRSRVRTQFASLLRKSYTTALVAVAAVLAAGAAKVQVDRAGEGVEKLARSAAARVRFRQMALAALHPGAAPGRADKAAVNRYGKRAVTLPGVAVAELTQAALKSRGAKSLGELANALRDELGAAAGPTTEGEAEALAVRIKELVAAACGTASVFSQFPSAEAARNRCRRLYRLSRAHVGLQYTSQELGVYITRIEQVALPLAETPAHEEIRQAIIDELAVRSGNRIKVIDRPVAVRTIRVTRYVAGYSSANEQMFYVLMAAYERSREFGTHEPHPFDGFVRVEADGYANTDEHATGE